VTLSRTYVRTSTLRKPPPPRSLDLQNCGERWNEVELHLKQVSGLQLRGTIFFVDWELNAQATNRLSKVIKILMETGRIEETWRVILMCKKPAMRLGLLNACSPAHRDLLTSSKDENVCEFRSRAMTAVARAALRRHDLPEFFSLLPLLSKGAAASFVLPPLTLEDLGPWTNRRLSPLCASHWTFPAR
jgi:hypothetical protein